MIAGRWLAALVFAFIATASPAPVSARASAPNVVASLYDATLDLRPDGSLDVVERITLSVGSTPITWFERRVPDRRTDGLTNVVALLDGREVPRVDRGPGVRIRQRGGIDVRWEFEPTANRARTFELRYRATHVLTPELEGPRLQWTALPQQHDYPISSARVRLRAPQGTLAVAVAATGGDIRPATSWQDGLVVSRDGLRPNDSIALDVTFSAATIAPAQPAWVLAAEFADNMMPAFIAAGLALASIGFGTLVMVAIRTKRKVVLAGAESAPAEVRDAAPAVAAALLNRGRTSGWLSLQAAFFRLVRDGQLVVEKTAAGRWYKGPEFSVKLGITGDSAPHEQWILDGVATAGGVADLRRLTTKLARRQRGFGATLRAELIAQGQLDPDRIATARALVVAGIALLVLAAVSAVVLDVFLADRLGQALLAMPAGVFADAVAFIIAGSVLSLLSEKGARDAARWRARVAEIRQVIRAKGAGYSLTDFERWLPIAIGAGMGGPWVRAFDAQLRAEGTEIAWMKAMGSPADARASIAMIVAISGASHSGGAGGGAGAGGGSSAAG